MAREVICGIYKITNLINGKVYIGQSKDIYYRWYDHKKESRKNRKDIVLYCAFAKYGIENFSFEIVEECSLEDLDEKEIFYIKQYNSYINWENSNGYNMTIGGALCHTHVGNDDQGIKVYQYDKDGNFISEYRNMNKAAKAVGLKGTASILQAIKKNGLAKGYQWRREYIEKIPKYTKKKNTLKVLQYDKEGNFIKIHNSIEEASRSVNCNRSLIEQCCEGHCKTGKGFIWRYYKSKFSKKIKTNKYKSLTSNPIEQYTLDGELVNRFESSADAERKTGFSQSAIAECARGINKTSFGYVWKFINKPKVHYNKKPRGKKIAKLNLNFNLLKVYSSITETCSNEHISDVTLKKYIKLEKPFKGFYWKYYEDFIERR